MAKVMQTDTSGDYMTPAEVAQLFRVDVKSLARWAADGKIEFVVTPGGHRRYARSEVDRLLREGSGR